MHLLQEDHTISLESGFEALHDIYTSPFFDRNDYLFFFSFIFNAPETAHPGLAKKKGACFKTTLLHHAKFCGLSLSAFKWRLHLADHA